MRLVNKLLLTLLPAILLPALANCATNPSTTVIPHLQIVDAGTGKPVSGATVTINGAIVAPDAKGGFTAPQNADAIMARAPGYRAVKFSVADVVKANGKLDLPSLTVKALFLTEYGIASSALRDPVLDIIRHGNANALVINIKTDHGFLCYPSEIPLATAIGARKLTTIHSLPELVQNAHAQGIYMIARIVTFKDDPLATARPELGIHTVGGALFKDGEHLSWTDPFQAEVRAYNIAIAVEAAKAGFDEVQFDYVRFPDASTKLKVSGPTDEANRIKAISGFLAEAHKALIPYNVFESVDIFGYVLWNTGDTGIGQHLEEIISAVDYVCPMLYPSGFKYGIPGHSSPLATDADIYATINQSLNEALKRTNANPRKFRPWLQAFRDYAFDHKVFGANEVAIQIRAATDAGTDGWSLWNARNQYGDSGLADGTRVTPASR